MAASELEAAETELAEHLQQHEEALQDVRNALHLDPANTELIEVGAPCANAMTPKLLRHSACLIG